MVKLVASVCPKCGAKIKLPKDEPKGFCNFCGTEIIRDDEIIQHSVKMDKTGDAGNFVELADTALEASDFEEAIGYAKAALEINPKDIKAWLIQGQAFDNRPHTETNFRSHTNKSATYFKKATNLASKKNKLEVWVEVLDFFDTYNQEGPSEGAIEEIVKLNKTKKKYKMLVDVGKHLRELELESRATDLFNLANEVNPDNKEVIAAMKEDVVVKSLKKTGGGASVFSVLFGIFMFFVFMFFLGLFAFAIILAFS